MHDYRVYDKTSRPSVAKGDVAGSSDSGGAVGGAEFEADADEVVVNVVSEVKVEPAEGMEEAVVVEEDVVVDAAESGSNDEAEDSGASGQDEVERSRREQEDELEAKHAQFKRLEEKKQAIEERMLELQ